MTVLYNNVTKTCIDNTKFLFIQDLYLKFYWLLTIILSLLALLGYICSDICAYPYIMQ